MTWLPHSEGGRESGNAVNMPCMKVEGAWKDILALNTLVYHQNQILEEIALVCEETVGVVCRKNFLMTKEKICTNLISLRAIGIHLSYSYYSEIVSTNTICKIYSKSRHVKLEKFRMPQSLLPPRSGQTAAPATAFQWCALTAPGPRPALPSPWVPLSAPPLCLP